MNARGAMILVAIFLLAACGGGHGGGSANLSPAPLLLPPPPAPTYPEVPTFTPGTVLEGPQQSFTIDLTAKTLAPSSGGSATIQVTGSTTGISSLTVTITGVSGATFSETFLATDLTTSFPVPGQAPRTLLSGTKTASDGSVRALTVLDTATAGFSYMVLGSWEYASSAAGTSAVGQQFVAGSVTRSADIPITGTAAYNGVMFGRYADGANLWTATAFASAQADFANRTVAFNTTGTQLTTGSITQSAQLLNLSGVLTYPAATNNLTGTLTTTGSGPLSGSAAAQFYGPAAAEIGGTFFVRDPLNTRQMTGSFGLKK